jgi:hypothetical protein
VWEHEFLFRAEWERRISVTALRWALDLIVMRALIKNVLMKRFTMVSACLITFGQAIKVLALGRESPASELEEFGCNQYLFIHQIMLFSQKFTLEVL